MTANEQKQQLSVAYVHAVAARAGYACQVKVPDEESVAVMISASGKVHEMSIIRSPRLEVQLKTTASPQLKPDYLTYPLKLKNYQDLREETLVPKLLVVLMLPKSPAEWLEATEECMILRQCAYWASLLERPGIGNSTRVSVRLPRVQQFSVDQLQGMMRRISTGEPL